MGAEGGHFRFAITQRTQEKRMSKSAVTLLAICVVAFVAACAKKPVVVEETVTTEPTYTGKYK